MLEFLICAGFITIFVWVWYYFWGWLFKTRRYWERKARKNRARADARRYFPN